MAQVREVPAGTPPGAVFADDLSPQKARILLMLGLQTTINGPEIQRLFDK